MKLLKIAACLLAVLLSAMPAEADLSANSAFTLIQKVPPGEWLDDAKSFLGPNASERIVDGALGIKVSTWGKASDTWVFDVLHDEDTVRATRITWRTKSRSQQQSIFSQLTATGKSFFRGFAKFNGMNEAEWSDFNGRWIVRATLCQNITDGVILLSGIRDAAMDSGRFGF
jgi:hypothetical protein